MDDCAVASPDKLAGQIQPSSAMDVFSDDVELLQYAVADYRDAWRSHDSDRLVERIQKPGSSAELGYPLKDVFALALHEHDESTTQTSVTREHTIQVPLCQFTLPASLAQSIFVERIDADLQSDANTCSEKASLAIRNVANAIASQLHFTLGVRYAAFVEEDGGASLVIHSKTSKRELSFEATPSGEVIAVAVDEALRIRKHSIASDDTHRIRELIAWIQKA